MCADGVCDIIESCAKHKVSNLKFGDLEISFGPQAEATDLKIPELPTAPQITSNPDNEISDPRTTAEIEKLEADLRDAEVAELTLTDPRALERMIENGELDDADDEPGNE